MRETVGTTALVVYEPKRSPRGWRNGWLFGALAGGVGIMIVLGLMAAS